VVVDRKNPVDALGQAFRVRVRRVALREGWWRGDAGPLLGHTAEGEHPVALIPVPGGGYEAWNPLDRSGRKVNDAVAAELGPFAWSLYRPFPAGKLGAAALLRFGVQGNGRDLATAGMAAAAVAVLGLFTPIATGILYDSIIPGAERGQLVQLACVLMVCALGVGCFQVVRGIALLRLETRIGTALQAALWDRLLALPLPFFRNYSAGDLAVRAMGIEEIRRTLSGAAVTALVGGLFSLTNLGLLLHYDLVLGGLAAVMVAFAFCASLVAAWLQLRLTRETLAVRARSSGMVLQLLSGIAKLKVVGAEVRAFGVWAKLFGEQRRLRFRTRTLGGRLVVFNAVFPVLCTMILFDAILGRAGTPDALTTGQFLAFVAAFNLCLAATLSTSNTLINTLGVVPMYEQLKPILETPPEVSAGKHPPGELSGAIELQHVHFRYNADGPAVLHDVSVRIHPGEFVAFVGPSGSGKSTLFRLLLGFETPEQGSIYYDGQELSGLDIQAVRRQIGVVLQQGRLMAGDLFTNIVGSSLATQDDAWEAARMAGFDEDIRQMPMGMHTVLNEGGSTLSGGQRQRLMIARALVNRPRILLFDEATSALDNRSQDIVTQSLARLQTTRVVIAHRLSTIVNADQIHVVQAGRIVESGTCAELLARGGVFAEMARRQLV
jgi:NHLM bacteriocin system ABC transporter ATP-binding protein